ncbi:MAG: acyltransferase [Rhodocyclaceae bacterium]|nr:acyltransferase [Rhodocyclaceae bacterium]
MFGWFRFIAALMVVLTHICGIDFVAGIAVWGFFMLSGFLMTAVLNGRYGLDANGLRLFAVSRAWRLFPSYWASILLSYVAIRFGGSLLAPELFNPAMSMPGTVREVFAGLFIVGHTTLGLGRVEHALSPSAWAVDVEILMYVCSCLVLTRSATIAGRSLGLLTFVFVGLWFVARKFVAAGDLNMASQLLYSFLPAALLPYTIGTVLWFRRKDLPAWTSGVGAMAVGVAGLVLCTLVVFPRSVTFAYLGTLPFLALVLANLSQLTSGARTRAVDDFVGRMAYPVYLLHWLCGYLVGLAFPNASSVYSIVNDRADFTLLGVLTVTLVVVVLSAVLAAAVEVPLDRMRHQWLNKKKVAVA